jgi:UV excision repair protein RAD23
MHLGTAFERIAVSTAEAAPNNSQLRHQNIFFHFSPLRKGEKEREIMRVVVKELNEKRWEVDVPARGTVLDLKKAVQVVVESHPSVESQRLLYYGRILIDNEAPLSSIDPKDPWTGSVFLLSDYVPVAASASSSAPPNPPPAADGVRSESLERLMEMGFERAQAERALRATSNNLDRAVEYLFSH